MRFKKESMFMHPVFEEGAEMPAYKEGEVSFSFFPKYQKDAEGEEAIVCEFKPTITEPTLVKLIEEGKARVAIFMHCREVILSEPVFLDELEDNIYLIPAGEITGKTEFTLFIVATQKINDFTSDNFVEFFNGFYTVEEGAVLAYSLPKVFRMERESFKPMSSIMQILPSPEIQERLYDIDLSSNIITIMLDPKTYENFQKARETNNPYIKDMLLIQYTAALDKAIQGLDEAEEMNVTWAKVIKNLIEGHENVSFNDESHIIAQRLLKNPIGNFSQSLLNLEGGA